MFISRGSVAPAGTKSQMRDDGAGTLSVEMVGVKETDTGWYWCEVGDLQIPVYLNITQHAASMFTINLAEMFT